MATWGTLTHSSQGGIWWPQLGCEQVAYGGEDQQAVATDWRIPSCGSPSQCPCEGNGVPDPCTPLKNDTSLSRQTTLPLGSFPATHPLTPVLSAVSMQPTVLLSLDLFSQPHILALSPHQHQQTLVPGRGAQG